MKTTFCLFLFSLSKLFALLTLHNGLDFGDERLFNEVVLRVAAEDGAVVRPLRPELVAVPRAVPYRRVGGVYPLSVAVPGDGGQGVAAIRDADQSHQVALTDGFALGVALDFRVSRRV
jgi:hypothetical protein